jgi:2-oxoglutarate ferredoxin oxidoreductase subunit gamma
MQHAFLFSGFGGQGVMFVGQLVAYAGMAEGLNVTWIPSYGPEMRGGTAHCYVILSEKQIGSPMVTHPEIAVLFNEPSFDKYEPLVAEEGLLVMNSSLYTRESLRDDIEILAVPATKIADELGNTRLANVVMLGALLARRPVITLKSVEQALEDHLPAHRQELLGLNKRALEKGASVGHSAGKLPRDILGILRK